MRWAAGAAYINGKIVLIGGFNSAGGVIATVRVYTVSSNTWANGTALPTALGFLSAVGLTIGGTDYVFTAGGTGAAASLKTYRYTVSTNVWDDEASPGLADDAR